MTKQPSDVPLPPIGGRPSLKAAMQEATLDESLSLVGMLVLADLKTVAWRTALTGTSSLLDALVLCPGLHRQHDAVNLSNGEFPACGAMTTGYVFRVENQATVLYMQSISKTGHLTTLAVHSASAASGKRQGRATMFYDAAIAATVTSLLGLFYLQDWWALSFMLLLSLIRFAHAIIIRSQATTDWHGASETGEQGDLFILLSYDRWVRLRGDVDDLKAVTSGRWLRQATVLEEAITECCTILAYLSVALVANATQTGQLCVSVMLLANAVGLGCANACTDTLFMKGKALTIETSAVKYERRKTLAEQLIKESGRDDWAVAMGLIPPKNDTSIKSEQTGPAIM